MQLILQVDSFQGKLGEIAGNKLGKWNSAGTSDSHSRFDRHNHAWFKLTGVASCDLIRMKCGLSEFSRQGKTARRRTSTALISQIKSVAAGHVVDFKSDVVPELLGF